MNTDMHAARFPVAPGPRFPQRRRTVRGRDGQAGFIDPNGRGLGVVAADLDDDNRIDLYVANDMSANYLFRNLGGFRFEEAASRRRGGGQRRRALQVGDGHRLRRSRRRRLASTWR